MRLERVRRDFVANISHELKTPVGAVALLAEMLADEHDPATAQRFATRIEGEAQRLARSVDDLLELTQIEFGLPGGSSDVAMDEVVDEVLARVASVAGDRGISVTGPDGLKLWPLPNAQLAHETHAPSAAAKEDGHA